LNRPQRERSEAVGKVVLQFDVPKLVDRAYLPQNASLVGVSKEVHQSLWQAVA
jgi:hypothetical protein